MRQLQHPLKLKEPEFFGMTQLNFRMPVEIAMERHRATFTKRAGSAHATTEEFSFQRPRTSRWAERLRLYPRRWFGGIGCKILASG